jgi:antitoxin ParD1/3/4
MSGTFTIRLPEPLREFVNQRAGAHSVYQNINDYIRDLIRHDFEKEEGRKWFALGQELEPGLNALKSDFIDFHIDEIIREAKLQHGQSK